MALTGVMEQVLGGKKIADSPLGAHEQVQSGLSKKDANEFFNHEPPVRGLFTYRRLRQAVIPDSTWKKAHDTLSPEDEAWALEWMLRPHAELGNHIPVTL